MSIFSTDSSTHSQFNALAVPSPNPVHLNVFASNSNGASSLGQSQESITKNRRHGMYFHRPPVWRLRPCPRNNPQAPAKARSIPCMRWKGSSCDASDCSDEPGLTQKLCLPCPKCSRHAKLYTDCIRYEESDPWARDMSCETTAAAIGAQVDAEYSIYGSNSEDPLLTDSLDSSSHLTLSKENSKYSYMKERSTASEASMKPPYWQSVMKENLSDIPRPCFRQTKPGLCTRLQLCKDVRLEIGERWAIQEGSLVVCVDPSYTLLDRREGFLDEFELAGGDLYIVCHLYADLWALCIKVSFDSRTGGDSPMAGDSMILGFLPLCAVTLAENFGAFIQRCFKYMSYPPSERKHPGSGLAVIPPERSHSVNASKQIFQEDRTRFQLPMTLPGACSNLPLEDTQMDFVPLDSTLQQLFSKFGGWRERAHQLRSRVSLYSLRRVRSSEQRSGSDSSVLSSAKVIRAQLQMRGSDLPRFQDPRILMEISSSASQRRRWAIGTPAPGRTKRHRREIRDLIHSGSEKLRSSFWSSSDL